MLRQWSCFYVILPAAMTHAAYNITVNTTHKAARVCWLPSFDGGQPLHHVLWLDAVGL